MFFEKQSSILGHRGRISGKVMVKLQPLEQKYAAIPTASFIR